MIPRTIPTWQTKNWQEELSQLVTEPKQLFSLLELDPALLPMAEKAHQLFPLRVTRAFINRMHKGDPKDPLLRQVLPLNEEFDIHPSFSADPLQEDKFLKAPGLIHKYRGRVLLVAAKQCAINCRYCFRRHFDYQDNSVTRARWQEALNYIQQNPDIEEVILSGGDPLAVSDKQIAWLVGEIGAIPHIQRLRIHSRLPIVAPSRITEQLLGVLCKNRLKVVLVIHCNHAQEVDGEVEYQLKQLRPHMVTLNQTVLLRGINDNEKALVDLSKRLFSCGVMPYYLHLLDKVKGATHFFVGEDHALSLNQALLATLPGYLVPKLVKEVPNAPSKVPII